MRPEPNRAKFDVLGAPAAPALLFFGSSQYLVFFRDDPHLVLSFAVTRIFFCGDLCASHSFRGDPHLSADTAPKQVSCLQTQHPAPPSVCRHSTLQHPAPAGVCRHSTQSELVSAAPFHSASVRCVHPGMSICRCRSAFMHYIE